MRLLFNTKNPEILEINS